jgi:hypothetical protein
VNGHDSLPDRQTDRQPTILLFLLSVLTLFRDCGIDGGLRKGAEEARVSAGADTNANRWSSCCDRVGSSSALDPLPVTLPVVPVKSVVIQSKNGNMPDINLNICGMRLEFWFWVSGRRRYEM